MQETLVGYELHYSEFGVIYRSRRVWIKKSRFVAVDKNNNNN
jgi:hypothetical protein